MKLIHKNLTPFFWGPKATSRRGRQVEMAMCVRGVFKLQPGQPLEVIADPIQQGFMSGDVWDPADLDRTGPLLYSSDFADWKPNADLLLKGTCYPPKGADVACEVRFAVGDWEKTLRVVGPRTWKPGLVFGGGASDPEPFTHMPLTWQNAYGGEGFAANPVGRGFVSQELPTVEHPQAGAVKQGAKGTQPGCFLPVNQLWPPRAGKMGQNYGKEWEEKRAPFFSDDFDWTFFNAAPLDQQLNGYLRGDEAVVFENLHPRVRRWETRLPGLRLRGFVKDDQGERREVVFALDTLYADLDAGRLYLTWRGLTPARELDLSDMKVALLASEPLDSRPLPAEHYYAQMDAYEDDPVGLKDKLPPGFMEVANAVEAAEQAELKGEPMPDLSKVAASLPAGCPFPPWFLAAVSGDKDPLGIRAKLPPAFFSDDPIGLKAKLGSLAHADPAQIGAGVKAAGKDPEKIAAALEEMAKQLPPQIGDPIKNAAGQVRQGQAALKKQAAAHKQVADALAKGPPPEQPPEPMTMAKLQAEGAAKLKASIRPDSPPEVVKATNEALGKVAAMPSLDQAVAKALAPMALIKMPAPPKIPDAKGMLAAMSAKLAKQEAGLKARGVNHPLMGLFDLGRRLIDRAPRPEDVAPPDMSKLVVGLEQAKTALLGQGVQAATLAPLTGLQERLNGFLATLPQPKPGPERKDLAYQDLRGRSLAGLDLRGKSLARAHLGAMDLRGLDLSGADLREADLTRADLTGANLSEANLTKAILQEARLDGARMERARLEGADLTGASLAGAQMPGVAASTAIFQDADLSGCPLVGADLTEAVLQAANLSGADLTGAALEHARGAKAKLEGARLRQAKLRFADFTQADMRRADLTEADLDLSVLSKVRGDEADLSGAHFDMAQLSKSRWVGAKLRGVRSLMGSLAGSDLSRADLREARLEKVDFAGCVLEETDFSEAVLKTVMFRDVQAKKARFVKTDLSETSATGKAVFEGCLFVQAIGRRAVFYEAVLDGSDFSHALLTHGHFQGARGDRVNFFAADLKGAVFRQAKLKRSRFVRANLCDAVLNESHLVDIQFTGANCYEAKFIEAKLASCDWLEANLVRARFERAEGAVP